MVTAPVIASAARTVSALTSLNTRSVCPIVSPLRLWASVAPTIWDSVSLICVAALLTSEEPWRCCCVDSRTAAPRSRMLSTRFAISSLDCSCSRVEQRIASTASSISRTATPTRSRSLAWRVVASAISRVRAAEVVLVSRMRCSTCADAAERCTPSAMRAEPSSTAVTAAEVSSWVARIRLVISPAERCVRSASSRTSRATTENAAPPSPACAAMIDALSASSFVSSAISVITWTISSIDVERWDSRATHSWSEWKLVEMASIATDASRTTLIPSSAAWLESRERLLLSAAFAATEDTVRVSSSRCCAVPVVASWSVSALRAMLRMLEVTCAIAAEVAVIAWVSSSMRDTTSPIEASISTAKPDVCSARLRELLDALVDRADRLVDALDRLGGLADRPGLAPTRPARAARPAPRACARRPPLR